MYPPPYLFGLPKRFTQWRPGQFEAVQNSLASDKRFVIQNLPTGVGKSLLLYGESVISRARTLILTASKPLQALYEEHFKESGLLDIKGRNNYFCEATEVSGEFYDGTPATTVDHGPCQYGLECSLRQNGCIYYDLLRRARYERVVVTNYDLRLYSNLYSDGIGQFPLIMCDEAHNIHDKLSNALTINLPSSYEPVIGSQFPVESVETSDWSMWALKHFPLVEDRFKQAKADLKTAKLRTRKRLQQQISALSGASRALAGISNINSDWLVMPEKEKVVFAPVWVHKYAEPYLFRGASKIVMASATIAPHVISSLGISADNVDYFEYPSPFPPGRRPIYYYPVAKMSYDMDSDDILAVLSTLDDLIEQRLDRKGIIHTVSFSRQQLILKYSKFKRFMIANDKHDAKLAVHRFKTAKAPAILVGPSFGEGLDFPGKLCEYVLIPKIPFADSSHPVQAARAKVNPTHGAYEAAVKLQQFAGRGMRSETDWCETIITDEMFNIYRTRYRGMISRWFWDAVITVYEPPKPLELAA